jgi:hypothetical protein
MSLFNHPLAYGGQVEAVNVVPDGGPVSELAEFC